MSGLLPEYKIDNTVINKYVVQSLISQSQNISKSTTIGEVFNLCDYLIEYDQDPSDKSLKVQIKSIVDHKLTNKQIEKQFEERINIYRINMQKIYPLNKPGNFGRVLERKCRIVPKGVMEYEEGKQAKLKEVKTFINKVEHIQNKDLADLAWITTQPQKYKFRIILLDNNQNKKGIYFETLEEAQKVRAYFVSKYKKIQINNQVFGALKYTLLEGYAQGFVDKIKQKHLIKKIKEQAEKQKMEQSNSMKLTEIKFSDNKPIQEFKNNQQDSIPPLNPNEPQSSFNNSTIKIAQQPKRSFMTGFLDDLINRHNDESDDKSKGDSSFKNNQKKGLQLPDKTVSNLQTLNEIYRFQFFHQWKRSVLLDEQDDPLNDISSRLKGEEVHVIGDEQKFSNFRNGTFLSKDLKKSSKGAENSFLGSQKSSIQQNDLFKKFLSPQKNKPQRSPPAPNERELDQLSPPKQSSRANKILAHSRKQESIFAYPQKIEEEDFEQLEQNRNKKVGTEKLMFKSIEFLEPLASNKQKNQNINSVNESQVKGASIPTKNLLLIKPIITVTVCKRNLKEQEQMKKDRNRKQLEQSYRSRTQQKRAELIFNTIVKKVFRNSEYEMLPVEGDGIFETQEDLNNIYLMVSVSNFLTNEQLCETEIEFKDYCFSSYSNAIVDKNSTMRLKFQYKNTGVASPQVLYKNSMHSESSLFFSFPKIDPDIIHKIKTYWESEAVSNSYYNLQDNFNLFDAVTNSSNEAEPSNWWLDLDQIEYNYLCILQSSSIILGYKLVKPMLHIIRAVKNIHFKIQKIIEMLLSIILNLGSVYYFPAELTQVNHLHREVGLGKGTITFQNRVLLEVLLFDKFLAFECGKLDDKLQRKNISISHLMLEYTYELFSRNFPIEVLCEFWNYCSEQISKIPLIFFLTTIALCKVLSDKLIKCNRLSEVKQVFESKQIKVPSLLLNEIKHLRSKYFFKGEGFIEEIKQAFEQKPFEQVLRTYYRKISEKEELDKKEKVKYKRELSTKLQEYITPEEALQVLTKKVSQRKMILHIYFYQLPQFEGKLLIISGKNEYQSLGQGKNRYFIIGELTSQVNLKYTDWKGNCYTGELMFIQGFNEFKIKIYSDRKQKSAQIHYLAGLLTQTQIEMIKTNKKFSHFMGPNITVDLFKDELLKPVKDVRYASGQEWMTEPWFRDLRNMFSYGNKLFNQINYFMSQLQVQNITPEEKLLKIRQYSLHLSKEFFLCQNQIVFKHLLFQFYKISFISLKQQDFQCYFNDSLQNQFEAPKIIKCRFYCENREIKLEKELIEYHSKKTTTFLYGDLFIDQLVVFCQKHIKGKVNNNSSQGQLKLLYSTFGEIHLKVIPIKMENKSFMIDRQKYIDNQSIFHDISQKEPQILMTEILPSFAKISTILDYVNSNRTIDLREKKNQVERKVIPQSINLLKFAQLKFRNCLLLRYNKYPAHIEVPFFSYFCELTSEVERPKFKYFYMNNVKDSIKSICLAKQHLKCSANNKQQDKEFDKSLGLYGNLRRVIKEAGAKVNTVFFWTDHKDENLVPSSLVCVNYGYGVSRWETCTIKKYRKKVKERLNKKGSQGEKKGKAKIEYLVEKGSESYFAREYEVKLNPLMKNELVLHKDESESKFKEVDNDIKQGFSFLMNPSNLRDFVRSVKGK